MRASGWHHQAERGSKALSRLRKWLVALGEELNIASIAEPAVPAAAGALLQDPELLQPRDKLVGALVRDVEYLTEFANGHDWVVEEVLQHAVPAGRTAPKASGDGASVLLAEAQNAPCRAGRLLTHLRDSAEEELEPCFPIPRIADCLQPIVVLLAVAPEEVR